MYKKTKIVATISDMRCDVGLIQRLYDAGMNVVRLNTAHQDAVGMKRVIDNVREVSSHLAILVDTKGPEVRTTVTDQPIDYHKGDIVTIVGRPEQRTTRDVIAVSYPGFVDDLSVGAQILIDDGDLGRLILDQRAAAEQRQRQGKKSAAQARGERKDHHDVLACCSVAIGVGPQSGRAASAAASAGPKGLVRSAVSCSPGAVASCSIRSA